MKTNFFLILSVLLLMISCVEPMDESYKTKDFYPEIFTPAVVDKDPMETRIVALLQYTGYTQPEISGYVTVDSVSPDSVKKMPVYKYAPDRDPANFEYGIFISRNGNFGLNDPGVIHLNFKGTDKFKVKNTTDSTTVFNPLYSLITIVIKSESIEKRILEEWSEYSYIIYAKNARGRGYSARGSFITGGTLGFGITSIPTDSVSNITSASAQIKGYLVSTGGRTISTMGVVYSTDKSVIEGLTVGSTPNASSPYKFATSPTRIAGETGYFDVALTDLQENTKYYFRTYAVNGYRDNARNTVKFSDRIGTIETTGFDGFPIVTYGVTANKISANAAKLFDAEIAFKVASRRDQVTEYGYYIRQNGVFNKVVGVLNSNYKMNTITNEFIVLIKDLPAATETVFRPYVVIDGKENIVEKTPLVRFTSGVFGRIQTDPNNPGVYLNYDTNLYYELPGIEYNGFVYRFLDRNLGATKVLSDYDYPKTGFPVASEVGWLFQWGRGSDGHQKWDVSSGNAGQSPIVSCPDGVNFDSWEAAWNYKKTVKSTAGTDSVTYPYRGAFWSNGKTFSWIGDKNMDAVKSLWNSSKVGGKNNPCPPGYRVPTSAEMSVLLNLSGNLWTNFKNLPLPNGSSVPLMFPGSANIFRNASGSGYSVRPPSGYSSTTAFLWTCSPTTASGKIMPMALSLSKPTDKGAVGLSAYYSAAGCYVRCINVDIMPRP